MSVNTQNLETPVEQREVKQSDKSNLTKELSGAVIFISISLVVSFYITGYIPRIPMWGIAYFDPISLVWIICFLIYGYKAGLLCVIGGSLGLMLFDITPLVGPVMKFTATISFIVIPYLYARMKDDFSLEFLKKNFIVTGLIALVLRNVIMIIMNYLYMVYYFKVGFDWINFGMIGGELSVNGIPAMIGILILFNSVSSLFDVFISLAIVKLPQIQSVVSQ